MKLIVVTYSMSPSNLVFSHQRETVIALSKSFESVVVLTCESSPHQLPTNVKLVEVPWVKNSRLANLLKIVGTSFPILIRNRDSVVFSYMTDAHAAIIAPFAWLLRLRHVLWYAHARNSAYLVFSSFFLTKIVSSTPGSCNLKINQKKVVFINQGIKEEDFPFYRRKFKDLHRIFYYGRFDQSKNIHLFEELELRLNEVKALFKIEAFGKPTGLQSKIYFSKLRKSSSQSHGLEFHGPIARKSIPQVSQRFDVFLNLFTGSLDKTLIEVTLLGLPVVTWNQEFCSQFGTWSGEPAVESLDFIVSEILFLNSMQDECLQQELSRRFLLAQKHHSFDGWVSRLVSVIKDGAES